MVLQFGYSGSLPGPYICSTRPWMSNVSLNLKAFYNIKNHMHEVFISVLNDRLGELKQSKTQFTPTTILKKEYTEFLGCANCSDNAFGRVGNFK